jgi:hypothetical protein
MKRRGVGERGDRGCSESEIKERKRAREKCEHRVSVARIHQVDSRGIKTRRREGGQQQESTYKAPNRN